MMSIIGNANLHMLTVTAYELADLLLAKTYYVLILYPIIHVLLYYMYAMLCYLPYLIK